MHDPHEPIMNSGKKIHKTKEKTHQCYLKSGDSQISKNKEYSNFLHTNCDTNHSRDTSQRRSVTFIVHLFNGTLIERCTKKQSETSRSISNEETSAMYTGVLYQNKIRDFFR